MSEPTTDGAIAAATHFLALYDYAFSSGDTTPLMEMSAESCDLCTYVEDSVLAMVSEGRTSVGPPARVLSSRATEIRPDEWFSAMLRVEQPATQEVDADGKVVAESAANVTDFLFAISWLGDRWRVEAVDLTEVVE